MTSPVGPVVEPAVASPPPEPVAFSCPVRGPFGPGTPYHSQFYEDYILSYVFKGVAKGAYVDVGAYDSYLKGLYHYYNAFTRESIEKAVSLFRQSLERDPAYAPAYGGLASTYYGMSNIYLAPVEVMPKARAAALKAIEIDETFAEAHGILGLVLSVFDHRPILPEIGSSQS